MVHNMRRLMLFFQLFRPRPVIIRGGGEQTPDKWASPPQPSPPEEERETCPPRLMGYYTGKSEENCGNVILDGNRGRRRVGLRHTGSAPRRAAQFSLHSPCRGVQLRDRLPVLFQVDRHPSADAQ